MSLRTAESIKDTQYMRDKSYILLASKTALLSFIAIFLFIYSSTRIYVVHVCSVEGKINKMILNAPCTAKEKENIIQII